MQSRHRPAHSRVRHRVLALTVLLAFITYLDRVCISITAPQIMRDLSLNSFQMSLVFSAFTAAYALFEVPTGWWADRVGTRRVLTRIVVWWSFFTGLTATAWNYPSLLTLRFLFGVGEAGAWPNVARTFSSWFPRGERGTAQGIFFMGAHLGGGVTPLLVTLLLVYLPWRLVFVIFALTGLCWAAVWHSWFRNSPRENGKVSIAEINLIESDSASSHGAPEPRDADSPILRAALRSPSVWFLCLMYFTQTYGFYFYVTWYPTYLTNRHTLHGFSLSLLAGAPLLFSVAGDLLGGLATDRLSRRAGLRPGRCLVGGLSLLLASAFLAAGVWLNGAWLSGILLGFAGLFSNFLLGASWAACTDLAGSRAGTVSALMNTAGQLGGILSPIAYSQLTRTPGSDDHPLLVIAALYLVGAASWIFVHPEHPLVPGPDCQPRTVEQSQ
jgi:MFS transporter, ACS family, glucarate transporter